ncbi:hypothetical protein SAMN05660649_03992 [Desulfotomaculum arcticum]|uniref:Uncharacterized protein n=1 Tax=Desulfotruncus arcticus DSM 17038 TaxID=1121424 RepID=A0A1I2XLM9_9FIRM|nr:hypothetical protein [Desulfotruncus arcticus]SFH12991.1 hypothetical protein SAMN05660649_03992 [Desulfotomaculum arcticum] [Desulfotruncus arcticus DSM 17038]
MHTPGKTMLASLGIFIGIIIFGAHVIVENYNQTVAPDKPLVLMDLRLEQDNLQVTLLGDTLELPFKSIRVREIWPTTRVEIEHLVDIIEQRLKMMQQLVYEIKGWP